MKNYNFLKLFTLLLLSVVFIQCTSEQLAGPAGTNGTNGIDGTNGVDGATGTATCVSCHSESHRDPIKSSYLESNHFKNSVMFDGQDLTDYTNKYGGSCARCHSDQGYKAFLNGEAPAIYDTPEVISCTTCHEKHGTFDFETDGFDYALRALKPVTLIVDETITLDYGHSNACITCHQPKGAAPTNDGSDLFNVTSPYYGPHYGAQSTLLEGIQGAEIEGSMPYAAAGTNGTAGHRKWSSCTSCHMGSNNDNDGEHTMKPTLNTCISCHKDATNFDVHGAKTEFIGLFDTLQELLITKGILAVNNGSVGVVTGEHSFKLTQAYWNWKLFKSDGSHGIHNPKYMRALLTNSIESLQ